MIAVVFEPRFGSSKVMQALEESDYPVVGDKFPPWITEDQKQWNPKGFYEHGDPKSAIEDGIGEAAIKLRTDEVMSFALPEGARFILCVRNVKVATESQIRSGLMPWLDLSEGMAGNTAKYSACSEWLADKDVHTVSHEDWILNPSKERDRLMEWVYGV